MADRTNPTAKDLIYRTQEKVDVLEFQNKKLFKELAVLNNLLSKQKELKKQAHITLLSSDFEIYKAAQANLSLAIEQVKEIKGKIALLKKRIDFTSKELAIQKDLLEIRIKSYQKV